MKTLSLLLLLGLLAGCGGIRSTIGIDPGEQFVLGGSQKGAFTARLVNLGAVPVEVAERLVDGTTTHRATLAPEQSATLTFADGSAALLVNRSGRAASVRGVITGDTRLGMAYTPADG